MSAIVPRGPGLTERVLRLRDEDIVVLGGILVGYDGLATIHGLPDGSIAVVAPIDRAAELDALLAALREELAIGSSLP